MKRIILNFIKDKISTTFIYFINTFVIILFFYLYVDKRIPLFYLITISTFLYVMFLVFQFYTYYKFNLSIKNMSKDSNIDGVYAITYEQKGVKQLLHEMNKRYICNVNSMKEENKINNKFFSQWVHNMKTPVSIIEIIIQKIIENLDYHCFTEKLDDSMLIYKYIEEIREENTKLLDGLDQILNMIRIEDFSKDYIPEAVDLCDSLKKVINQQKNQFIYNKVFPKVLCECENTKILTDRKWNEFMIGQIISNAIKYSRAGEVEKDVSKFVICRIEREENHIVLNIKDEGIGIPSYDINRVFEAFFTGTNGRKHKQSTGIGLYICKIICGKLGHEISVRSEVKKETEIKIKYLSKS